MDVDETSATSSGDKVKMGDIGKIGKLENKPGRSDQHIHRAGRFAPGFQSLSTSPKADMY